MGFKNMFINIFPVIIGGLIGIIGAYISPYLNHKFKQSSEKKAFKRHKLEEAVTYAFRIQEWLEQIQSHELHNGARF